MVNCLVTRLVRTPTLCQFNRISHLGREMTQVLLQAKVLTHKYASISQLRAKQAQSLEFESAAYVYC